MGNYKGIKFANTMEGFKRWTKEFPPMDKDAVKAKGYQKKDDLYLELQLVQGFITDSKFVSASVRKFDHESENFENVGFEEEKRKWPKESSNKKVHQQQHQQQYWSSRVG